MRLAAAVVVSLALGALAARTIHSQAAPAPLEVGFVDVDKVLSGYRKREAMEKEFVTRSEQLQARFRQERTGIEAKREKLATLAEGSEDYLRLEREADIALLTWKRDQEFEDRRLKLEHNRRLGLVYREICSEIRVQAEKRGLAAVYAYDPLPAGFETRTVVASVIQNRDVLWADGRLDISSEVVEALNADLPPSTDKPAPEKGAAPSDGTKDGAKDGK